MSPLRLKLRLRQSVRAGHVAFLNRGLPNKLAIYFHSLEPPELVSLEECAEELRAQGYRFVHIDEFLDEANSRVAFLSFDDNYQSWYHALNTLDRLELPATFYVNTNPLRDLAPADAVADYFDRLRYRGEPTTLNTDELRAIRDAGHLIGAHTHEHAMLTAVPQSEAENSILTCKRTLENILGEQVLHFSYPFGMRRHFNTPLMDYCKRVGFRTVASAIPGLQHGGHSPYRLNRTLWRTDQPIRGNLENLSVDGRVFERLTGLSPVG